MLEMKEVITIIVFFLPVSTPFICGMILLAGFRDNISQTEIQLKKVLLYYYISAVISWFCVFENPYYPVVFAYLNSICLFSTVMIQVYFYQLICILTKVDKSENRFSSLHYVVPVIISLVMLVWSFFIPFPVQVALSTGKKTIYSGYETYSIFFFSKAPIFFLFSLIYAWFTFNRVRNYFRMVNQGGTLVRKPGPWIILILGLTGAWLVVFLCAIIDAREEVLSSTITVLVIFLLCSKHIILLYNIIRRRFLLYNVVNEPINSPKTERENGSSRKQKYKKQGVNASEKSQVGKALILNKKSFEVYMQQSKPYLNPELKITDLVEPLDVNRAYISGFINRTYAMNFNAYINQCRLRELDRLMQMPINKEKDIHKLVSKAGFASFRNYTRAVDAEQVAKMIEK